MMRRKTGDRIDMTIGVFPYLMTFKSQYLFFLINFFLLERGYLDVEVSKRYEAARFPLLEINTSTV